MSDTYSDGQLHAAGKHSSLHRQALERSLNCGCYACGAIFSFSEITNWTDWPGGTSQSERQAKGRTATCPSCDIDAVIGDASGYPISRDFLTAMSEHWFNKSI